jgi:hypothetical protein
MVYFCQQLCVLRCMDVSMYHSLTGIQRVIILRSHSKFKYYYLPHSKSNIYKGLDPLDTKCIGKCIGRHCILYSYLAKTQAPCTRIKPRTLACSALYHDFTMQGVGLVWQARPIVCKDLPPPRRLEAWRELVALPYRRRLDFLL